MLLKPYNFFLHHSIKKRPGDDHLSVFIGETQTGEFLVGAVSPIEHTAMNPQLLFIASARLLAFGYVLIILERYVKTMYEFQTN
jgi:hypothetical protein